MAESEEAFSLCLQRKNRLRADAAQLVCVVLAVLSWDKERLCLVTHCSGVCRGMFFFFPFFFDGQGGGGVKVSGKG